MSYSVITDDAFILSARQYKENDRMIECFTEKYGRCFAYARSVRKETSRLRLAVIPYQYSRITLVIAKHNIVKDIKTKESLNGIWRAFPQRYAYVSLLGMLSQLTPEGEPHPPIFQDMLETVDGLSSSLTPLECSCWKDAYSARVGIELGYIPSDMFASTVSGIVKRALVSEKYRKDMQLTVQDCLLKSHL